MNEMYIVFKNLNEVSDFVNAVGKYPYEMDMMRGRYVIDAKSILGVMNMGLEQKIQLKVYDDNCEDLKREISRFVAA